MSHAANLTISYHCLTLSLFLSLTHWERKCTASMTRDSQAQGDTGWTQAKRHTRIETRESHKRRSTQSSRRTCEPRQTKRERKEGRKEAGGKGRRRRSGVEEGTGSSLHATVGQRLHAREQVWVHEGTCKLTRERHHDDHQDEVTRRKTHVDKSEEIEERSSQDHRRIGDPGCERVWWLVVCV